MLQNSSAGDEDVRLIGNARVLRYLTQNYLELLMEFQKIAASGKAAA